jgi:phosphoribosylamine--glycine ligase
MNILILGAGGREHALAWKLAQSTSLTKLFVAPGNAGTAVNAKNIPIGVNDFEGIKTFVLQEKVNMVVVGPEDPLVHGIHDFFLEDPQLTNIPIIGPQKAAAALEGSKQFAKEFMMRHTIPTAQYKSFTKDTLADGIQFLEEIKPPYVLKADGLAAGKGVVILNELKAAKAELTAMLQNAKFGAASHTVVIEEFLKGIELSVFVLTDGTHYKILPTAKDYKRIGEGDTGLNTGGMGAISPVPFADSAFMQKIEDGIVKPTINGLKKDGLPYKGFIFIGLIKVNGEPKVIEYNVRMGDPETEAVIPRIKNDLVEVFKAVASGNLDEIVLDIDERAAATVMMVSGGYPEAYEKGKEISGIENVGDSIVFHAGTKTNDKGKIVTNGGRVLAITSFGTDFRDALEKSYKSMSNITFEDMHYRKDLGFDL